MKFKQVKEMVKYGKLRHNKVIKYGTYDIGAFITYNPFESILANSKGGFYPRNMEISPENGEEHMSNAPVQTGWLMVGKGREASHKATLPNACG